MPSTPDDDGWTHVRTSKRSRAPQAIPSLPAQDRAITVQTLQVSYQKHQRIWKASSCRKELLAILDKTQPDDGWQLTNAVCLASGSFSRHDLGERHKRAMFQFVAFMDAVAHVQRTSDEQIKMYAEELIYTDVDIAFLTSLSIFVHNDPDLNKQLAVDSTRWAHIGPHSMVFELYMDPHASPLRHILNALPGLLIGALPTGKLMQVSNSDQRDRALADTFAAARNYYHFPRFHEDPSVFEGLQIYWKIPLDEDD